MVFQEALEDLTDMTLVRPSVLGEDQDVIEIGNGYRLRTVIVLIPPVIDAGSQGAVLLPHEEEPCTGRGRGRADDPHCQGTRPGTSPSPPSPGAIERRRGGVAPNWSSIAQSFSVCAEGESSPDSYRRRPRDRGTPSEP